MISLRIDIYHHFESPGNVDIPAKLELMHLALTKIDGKVDTIMSAVDDLRTEMAKIDAATTEIGADLTRLAEQIAGGISAADAVAVVAELKARADTLTAMGAAQ